MICPKCKSDFCYAPFYGNGFECVNRYCEHYNEKHAEAMKEEIEASSKKNEEELETGYVYAPYIPLIVVPFPQYASGPYKKP